MEFHSSHGAGTKTAHLARDSPPWTMAPNQIKSSQLSSFEIIAVSCQLSIAATFLSSSTLGVTTSNLFKSLSPTISLTLLSDPLINRTKSMRFMSSGFDLALTGALSWLCIYNSSYSCCWFIKRMT
ncbi:hypothetical protein L484_005146 [Morus notabilis]|uniref:Uncharacterized protein n=1 Tax=Morus notabilis TaxID=981085 RepID=W9QF76_9ROSA|nr:hypothetical protein L484_005146 [Morus notabilis]